MKKSFIIWICLFAALLPFNGQAQSQVGTTASAFLEIPAGARSIGMGESHVSVADDIMSIYWNPAGITSIEGNEATFQNTEWFVDTKLYYAAAAFQFDNKVIGGFVYMFDGGNMDVRTVTFPEGTGESFSVYDISLGLTYAQRLTQSLSVGGNLKYVQNRIWRMSAGTVAMDLGFHYKMPVEGLKLGFSISNFGGEMKMEGDNSYVPVDLDPQTSGNNDGIPANLRMSSWDLPLIFRIGTNYRLFQSIDHSLVISADAIYPNNNDPHINAGAEYGFKDLFFLRGGYSHLFVTQNYAQGNLRFGGGVAVADRIGVDYAYSDRGELGSIHSIGVVLKF